MADSPNTRSRVYVLCRPIFSGDNAHVRRPKKVKELINKGRKSLRPLLWDIGEEKVVEILRSLLEARIFESELRAKVEFPELFHPSHARDAQHEASEADAARSTAEALDVMASRDGGDLDKADVEGSETEEIVESEDLAVGDKPDPASTEVPTERRSPQEKIPSLYPSYLPYRTQHMILTTAQQVLEECCFDFATTSMPSTLQEMKWDCPAAVELTRWTKIFRKGKYGLHTIPIDFDNEKVLKAVSNLRHTAVHRLPTTARGISQLLVSAVKFAQILQDDLRAAQLEELRCEMDSKIKAMELNKNVLEDTVSSKLQEIQKQRDMLDKMETELIQGMLKDDMENKTLIGQLLEDSVCGIFNPGKEMEKEEDEGKEEREKEDGDGRHEENDEKKGGEEGNGDEKNGWDDGEEKGDEGKGNTVFLDN